MSEPSPAELVAAAARDHPTAHPYSLSLLIEAQSGRRISGQEVARLLQAVKGQPIPIQTGAERLCLSQPSTSEP